MPQMRTYPPAGLFGLGRRDLNAAQPCRGYFAIARTWRHACMSGSCCREVTVGQCRMCTPRLTAPKRALRARHASTAAANNAILCMAVIRPGTGFTSLAYHLGQNMSVMNHGQTWTLWRARPRVGEETHQLHTADLHQTAQTVRLVLWRCDLQHMPTMQIWVSIRHYIRWAYAQGFEDWLPGSRAIVQSWQLPDFWCSKVASLTNIDICVVCIVARAGPRTSGRQDWDRGCASPNLQHGGPPSSSAVQLRSGCAAAAAQP